MADMKKKSRSLLIECVFYDGDTRTITLRNPRNDISSTDIKDLETFILENNILIGDREESDFRKIKRALRRNSVTTYLDLS